MVTKNATHCQRFSKKNLAGGVAHINRINACGFCDI